MNINKTFYIFFLSIFIINFNLQAAENDKLLENGILSGSEDTLPSQKKIYVGNICEFREILEIKRAQPEEQKELMKNYINKLMEKLQKLKAISEANKVSILEELFQKIMHSLEDSKIKIANAIHKNEGPRPIIEELNFILLKTLIAAKSAAWDIKKTKRRINLSQESFETFELTAKFYQKHIIDYLTGFYLDAVSSPHNNPHLNFLPFVTIPQDKLTGLITLNLTFLNDMYIAYLPKENKCNIHTVLRDRCAFLGHELFHMTAEGSIFFNPKNLEKDFFLKKDAKEIFTNLLVTSYKASKNTNDSNIYFKSHLMMFLLVHEGKLKPFIEALKDQKSIPNLLNQIVKYYKNKEQENHFISGDYLLLYFFKELNYILPPDVDMKKLPEKESEVIHTFLVNGVIDITESLQKLYV